MDSSLALFHDITVGVEEEKVEVYDSVLLAITLYHTLCMHVKGWHPEGYISLSEKPKRLDAWDAKEKKNECTTFPSGP